MLNINSEEVVGSQHFNTCRRKRLGSTRSSKGSNFMVSFYHETLSETSDDIETTGSSPPS
jgi:hypothetical protein